MGMNLTGIVRPEEVIKTSLGGLGTDLVYEENVFGDATDEPDDTWTSGVELISPLGGALQASWERVASGELLGAPHLGPLTKGARSEPCIEVYYREWAPDKSIKAEFHLADVASPEMAAAVISMVYGQHQASADSISGDNLSARQPDRNKVTVSVLAIIAEVSKVAYAPGEEADELDNAREAASMLIEMAGFDLDDSDGMGQPMGITVLGLILSACHLVPQMRDRILGRADDVRIEVVDL